jgi:hypothetical protein
MADAVKAAPAEKKADIGSTNAPRGVNEPAADAIADDSGGAGAQKAIQEATDEAQEKGFIGEKVDQTPRENYTLAGVAKGLPTPETTQQNRDRLS